MDRLLHDVRYALRMLARSPAFTAVAVLTLALGIGANTAMFTVVDAVMLRPLPYPEADRIVLMTEAGRKTGDRISTSWQTYQDWRDQNTVFDEFGVYRQGSVSLTSGDRPERLTSSLASSGVFRALGAQALTGRLFTEVEDRPGAPLTVLVSERLWRSRFGSDPALVGRDLVLDSQTYTVAGIVPAEVRFPARTTDLWLPLGPSVDSMPTDRGNHPGLYVIGRIRPGLDFEQAQAAMRTLADRLSAEHPTNRNLTIWMTPIRESLVGEVRPAVLVLFGAVGFVLLIACANLANLTLARADRRRRELAVRAALGAGRARLVHQLVVEAVVLSLAGGAAGTLVAWSVVRAFVVWGPRSIPGLDQIALDWRAVAFALAASMATGVLFGLVPALRASAMDLQSALREGGRGGTGRQRLRSALVVAEVAVAVMLLVGAGLTIRSLQRLLAIDPGFEPSRALSMWVTLPDVKYPDVDGWARFYRDLVGRVSVISGVEAAGVNSILPLAPDSSESGMIAEGDPLPHPDRPPRMCLFQAASGGYFGALGIQFLGGRTFTERDDTSAPLVAVVDDMLASALWAGADPIGKRFAFEFTGHYPDSLAPVWREVVGVVRHVKHYGLTEKPLPQVYVPYTQLPLWQQEGRPAMALVIRSALEPESVTGSVRRELAAIDPDLPVYDVYAMTERMFQQVERPRFSMALLTAFGFLALTLALVGIYGVLSYVVSERTQEIGVRMALGAGTVDVLSLVLRQGLGLALVGLALGLAGAWSVTRVLQSLLYEVSPTDPATFAAVAGVMLACAFVATYVPARRATRVDPMEVLRHE